MIIESKVGFDRTLKLEWLDITADLTMQGYSAQEINQKLDEFLMDQIKGKDARRKTRTVLLATWVKTCKELLPFRSDAFNLLDYIPKEYHIVIHWGMSMATYPFFGHMATNIGRLINLQGTVSSVELQRRVKEVYGERQTVSRAVQRLLRTFIDWEVLNDTGKSGIYAPSNKIFIVDKNLVSWLVEGFLYYNRNSAKSWNEIVKNPVFFPFDLSSFTLKEMQFSNRIDIIRQGLDEELLFLHNPDKNSN